MRIYNYPLCENANHVQLQIYRYAFAVEGPGCRVQGEKLGYTRLYYVLEGSGWLGIGRNQVEMEKGCWYLMPAGGEYFFQAGAHIEMLTFHISLSAADRVDLLFQCRNILSLREELSQVLIDSLYEKENLMAALQVRHIISSVVLKMLQEYQISIAAVDHSPTTTRAICYIHENLNMRLTTPEICEAAGVSKSTIAKTFQKDLGKSVQEYITECVLTEARHMLLRSECSIHAVAEQLGFSSQSYFCKKFIKRFGLSPREYRKSRS